MSYVQKLPTSLRLLALTLLAFTVTRCGVETTSDVQAIKGKEVFRIQAKKALLESQVPGAFAALEPIRQTVSSVQVVTTSEVLGVEIVPVPNADLAQIDIVASIKSNNQFSVESLGIEDLGKGSTEGKGRKSILIDANGIRTSAPSFDGKTVITPTPPEAGEGIFGALSGLAAKAAASQFTQKQADTEKEIYKKTGEAVAGELNKKIDPMVTQANQYYQDYFFKPFYATHRFPAYLNFESTADSVIVSASSEKYGMSVADRSGPAEHDLSFQIHESFVNNFFLRNIKTYRPMSLEDVKKLIAAMPIDAVKFTSAENSLNDKVKDVKLDFSHGTPILLSIIDNKIKFTVRAKFSGTIVALSNLAYTSPVLEATASYGISMDPAGKLVLKRELVDIKQVDNASADAAISTLVKPAMEKVFKEQVDIPQIPLKKASGELSHLQPTSVASQGGWLNITWKIMAGAAPSGPTLSTDIPGSLANNPATTPTNPTPGPTLDNTKMNF